MLRAITLASGLFLLWLLLSGIYKPLIIGLGIASCIVTILIAMRMGILKPENRSIGYSLIAFVVYLVWLTKEIVKANWAVTKVILSGNIAIRQKMFRVPVSQQSDLGKVVFANSITLTPGTITVETEDDYFLTHALAYSPADMDALADMDQRVSAIESPAASASATPDEHSQSEKTQVQNQ